MPLMTTTIPRPPSVDPAIRAARRPFAAMVGSYSLGVFNDNFFKQAVIFLALMASRNGNGMLEQLPGLATVLFILPFMLLAAPAGYLADRFPKRTIVIACKVAELLAMIVGAIAVWQQSWWLMLAMIAFMGCAMTAFSPALNGMVPELYPARHVLKANSFLKMSTTSSILLGSVLAGVALNWSRPMLGVPLGWILVGAAVLVVAIVGLIVSPLTPARPAANPKAPFPWSGPIDTVKVLYGLKSDHTLRAVVWLDAYVWFVAALQVLLVVQIGVIQFGMNTLQSSYLTVAVLVGVGAGGLLAGRLVHERWLHSLGMWLAVLAFAMTPIFLVPQVPAVWAPLGISVPLRLAALCALLVMAGLGGGLVLVPLEAFIQARPAHEHKGQIIAAANFAAFAMMGVAGLVYSGLDHMRVPPTASMAFLTLPTIALGLLWRWALKSRIQDDRSAGA